MQDHVYKTTELVGTSDKGIEDAVQKAVGRAAKTVRNMCWSPSLPARHGPSNGPARSTSRPTWKVWWEL
jgi:hypothetical protein